MIAIVIGALFLGIHTQSFLVFCGVFLVGFGISLESQAP